MIITYNNECQSVTNQRGDSRYLQYILGFNSNYEAEYLDINSLIYNNIPDVEDVNPSNYDNAHYAIGEFVDQSVHNSTFKHSIQGYQGIQGVQGIQGIQGLTGRTWDTHGGNGTHYLRSTFIESTQFIQTVMRITTLLLGRNGNVLVRGTEWDLSSSNLVFTGTAQAVSSREKFKAGS